MGGFKTMKKYVVPHAMRDTSVVFTNFPRIYRPDKVDGETFIDKIKPIFKGNAHITFSDRFKDVMNTSQGKRYTINKTYLKLMREIFNLPIYHSARKAIEGLELPFVFESDMIDKKLKINSLRFQTVKNTPQRHVIEKIQMQLAANEASNKIPYEHLMSITGSSIVDITINDHVHSMEREYVKMLNTRRSFATTIKLAEIYSGFQIYVSDSLCSFYF
jgi:hypothetical protein